MLPVNNSLAPQSQPCFAVLNAYMKSLLAYMKSLLVGAVRASASCQKSSKNIKITLRLLFTQFLCIFIESILQSESTFSQVDQAQQVHVRHSYSLSTASINLYLYFYLSYALFHLSFLVDLCILVINLSVQLSGLQSLMTRSLFQLSAM